LAEDDQVKRAVEQEIQRGALVTALVSLRIQKGKSQKQVAESMKCDPSKVSRLEGGDDDNLSWLDVVGYVNALGLEMNILLDDKSLPAAGRIKQSVFIIDAQLKKLTAIAKQAGDDKELVEKIHKFYAEVLFNFLKRFGSNYKELSSMIRISLPEISQGETEDVSIEETQVSKV
jgi:transcriptional regulator with XRE-family HTH domain